jgi:AcrR family transcriptional regulator
MTPAHRVAPRRERARAATIEEIKQTALRLMRESGTTDIRFTDIARAMDLTPPALYRYFADRDALLNALIADAYRALGRLLAAARHEVPVDDLGGRWLAISQAYRGWARREPQQFALILGVPVPGFVAAEDGPTSEAAHGAMGELAAIFVEAQRQGRLGRPLEPYVHPAIEEHAGLKHHEDTACLPAASFQAMLHSWATLHGFTTLEAYGHFDWLGPEAREALFLGQVRLAARAAGIPVPEVPAE